MIEVHHQIDASLADELRTFLCAAPNAAIEHDPAWLSILHHALGHRPFALVSRKHDRITGYLPLAFVSTRLFGRFLVSLPYLNLAGPVADDPATASALIHRAAELADDLDADHLELRLAGSPIDHSRLGVSRSEKVRMLLDLPADPQTLWQSIGSKVRNQVRKAESFRPTIRVGGVELVDDFYRIFSVNMRDLGTPVYPRKLFAEILSTFRGKGAELAVVDIARQPAAAALLLHEAATSACPARTQIPSASALRQLSHTNANMWMYHQLLLRAIERGSALFDFGRSSLDSGTYRFKKQWGAQPHPTVWQYYLRRGAPDALRPDNPRYRRRIAAWQKLPVWLANALGPRIVCGIP